MELSKTDKILLHLTLISGVGPATVERLLSQLSSDQFDQLYSCSAADFMRWGLTELAAHKVLSGLADINTLERELMLLEKHHLQFITAFHDDYPSLLKHTHTPPLGLYVRGDIRHLYARSLAVVGSRQANEYGHEVVNRLVPTLAAEQWLIVSGGAIGVDTLAHGAAVRAGGKTIAVIGGGLMYPYPSSNRGLFDQIVERGGAIVSPFPLTMEALPAHFPARNRIIAGMTRGCLVIQAAAKSGALITADIALKEGREVFAVPGAITDPLSAGCHRLLQQGAHLVQTVDDIAQAFGFASASIPEKELPVQQRQLTISAVAPDMPPLLVFCKSPKSVDELLSFERCTQQELYDKIWEYQVNGQIEEVAAGKWKTSR